MAVTERHCNRLARIEVEKVLGKPLRKDAPVHHVDGVKSNLAHTNLVACNDHQYHMILEQRTKALKECGHASWRKCCFCKRYDDPINMIGNNIAYDMHHKLCKTIYCRGYSRGLKRRKYKWQSLQ